MKISHLRVLLCIAQGNYAGDTIKQLKIFEKNLDALLNSNPYISSEDIQIHVDRIICESDSSTEINSIIDTPADTYKLYVPVLSNAYQENDFCKELTSKILAQEKSDNRVAVIPIDNDIRISTNQMPSWFKIIHAKMMADKVFKWGQYKESQNSEEYRNELSTLVARVASNLLAISGNKLVDVNNVDSEIESKIQECLVTINEISARVEKVKLNKIFKTEIMLKLLKGVQDEISQLTQTDYKQNLSLEQNFIIRAGAIFESASKVYAISIDEYSEFWIAADQIERAQMYTKLQPKNTKRGFVFSSIENAWKYHRVLAAHYKRYGTEGSVFFCSRENYDRFVQRVYGEYYKSNINNRDFAYLIFDEGRSQEFYEASLTKTTLEFRLLKDSPNKQQQDVMGEIDQITQLLSDPEKDNFDESTGFATWSPEFGKEKEFEKVLVKIFGWSDIEKINSTRDINHFVFLSKSLDHDTLKNKMYKSIIPELEKLKRPGSGDKMVESIWFGKFDERINNISLSDKVFNGKIRSKNIFVENYPYCIVIKLKNSEVLSEYMEDENHETKIRSELYKLFNPDIETMYDYLDKVASTDIKKVLKNALEDSASHYFIRADYVHDNLDFPYESPIEFNLPAD